ncbi:uncharacterized protein [Arachis hypogaea]|uniref:uncharacterized protein n=1 Tax=Arachis hypogaea TaxID=3818 RepID=UPI003B22319E
MPFRLTYGTEAIIPIEIREPSPRFLLETFNQKVEKDLVDEDWKLAHFKETPLKQQLALRYNKKVKKQVFDKGDLVLDRNDIRTQKPGEGILVANWEGPYRV